MGEETDRVSSLKGGGGGLRLQRTLVDECMEKAEFQL